MKEYSLNKIAGHYIMIKHPQTIPRVFMFFKLYKWYKIAQRIRYVYNRRFSGNFP